MIYSVEDNLLSVPHRHATHSCKINDSPHQKEFGRVDFRIAGLRTKYISVKKRAMLSQKFSENTLGLCTADVPYEESHSFMDKPQFRPQVNPDPVVLRPPVHSHLQGESL